MMIFSLTGYAQLANSIAEKLKAETGLLTIKRFPNSERYLRIDSNVRGVDAVIVAGTVDDSTTLDIFDLANGLVDHGCRSLKLVIPFFSYSTMERATKPGEVVTAKTRARLLSSIPSAPFGNQILLLDLHSEGIPYYFEGKAHALHLYAKPLVVAEAKRLAGSGFVMGSVDAGRAKWVESLANDLGVSASFVYKRRAADGEVSISGINGPIGGADVVIYDDMIRSGSSLLHACGAYRDAGAKQIYVIATHADFTEGAVKRLKDSKLITQLVCTDSHPKALAVKDPFVHVLSTADIFAAALSGEENAH